MDSGLSGTITAPGLEQAIVGDEELGRVGQEQHDPVTLLDAQVANSDGEAIGEILDLLIGQSLAKEIGARPGGIPGSRFVEQAIDGNTGIREVRRHFWDHSA